MALPYQNNLRAEQLVAQKTIFFPDIWSSYYALLASFYKLLQLMGIYDRRVLALVVFNVLLGGVSTVLVYKLSRRILSEALSFWAAVIFIFYYPLLYLNALNISENFSLPALLGALYLLLQGGQRRSWRKELVAGCFLGIAALCRPLLLPFLPLLAIWILKGQMETTEKLARLALVVLPVAALLLAASFVNFRAGRLPSLSFAPSGGANFAMAQCRLKKLRYQGKNESFYFTPPAFWQSQNKEVTTPVSFYDQLYYYKMGRECLRKNPGQLLYNVSYVKNLFASIFYPDFTEGPLHRLNLSFWRAVAIVFFVLFLLYPVQEKNSGKKRMYELFFFLVASLFVAVFAANPGEERYLAAYFFALEIFGLASLSLFLNRVNFHECTQAVERTVDHLKPFLGRKEKSS